MEIKDINKRDLVKALLNKEITLMDLENNADEFKLWKSVCGRWMKEEEF